MTSDTERASVPASIAESFIKGDPVHASASRSSGPTLSNAETLELFSQVVDVTFDQKFAAFKRDLHQKVTAIQSQLKKLRKKSYQPGKERSSRFGGRSVKTRLASLTVQLPVPKPAKLHLLVCPLAVCLLLSSLFFSHACSPYTDVRLNRQKVL